ncbi:MAG: hypothetical protein NNA20_07815, partial [Nitrospira sp.]|nr:hypothetical protein [Nitrospira sp.]
MVQRTIEILIEQTAQSFGIATDGSAYGVGRVLGTAAASRTGEKASWVLAAIDHPSSSTVVVPETACFPVPPSLGRDVALLAVPVAAALNVWDRLQLELGEVAVYTGGHPCSDLIGLVAMWRGGCPVIRLGDGCEPVPFQ